MDRISAAAMIPKNYNYADTFYDNLQELISDYQKELAKDEQLSLRYFFPSGETISIDDIGYYNPSVVIFHGTTNAGDECHILAHMNSVQLLVTISKAGSGVKRKQIGFTGSRES